ncbi:sensor histidine kinase [Rhizobium sp. YIM 134829]|uniref:sensor histidine kinase n=1 Tax=Rhizobium sp. YIM 134829 TaxID=3390453 RepID=UPI00397D2076
MSARKAPDGAAGQIASCGAPGLVGEATTGSLAQPGSSFARLAGAIALIAFPVAPLALSAILPASLALPVGAGLAGALTLAGGLVGLRGTMQREPADMPPALPRQAPVYDCFAGLVTLHDPRGLVTAVHGRDREALRLMMRDPMGRGFVEQIHVLDRIAFLSALDQIRQGAPAATVDLRMERGSLTPETAQFLHLRCELAGQWEGDLLLGILVQSRDISAEVALRAEAARKTGEAERANEAKTRFLAAVSHELRTPLNAILGFSDILSGEYFGKLENDRQREYVALINQSGAHLLSVVNTMLDMSKIDAGRYELMAEPFPIAEAVKTCEQMLALQAEKRGITLIARASRGLGEIHADRRAVQQVLINLVGNALKFTEAGGVVTIDADQVGTSLRLVVADTGIGIPADKLAMLGEPFMQVQNAYTRRYEGTGLGLSLVKGLVGLHGGLFDIASREGEGTVITITLPMDGSGIVCPANEEATVLTEFPPRLTLKAGMISGESEEGGLALGATHAKTA